jgi:chaperonin cofactor prefoldin
MAKTSKSKKVVKPEVTDVKPLEKKAEKIEKKAEKIEKKEEKIEEKIEKSSTKSQPTFDKEFVKTVAKVINTAKKLREHVKAQESVKVQETPGKNPHYVNYVEPKPISTQVLKAYKKGFIYDFTSQIFDNINKNKEILNMKKKAIKKKQEANNKKENHDNISKRIILIDIAHPLKERYFTSHVRITPMSVLMPVNMDGLHPGNEILKPVAYARIYNRTLGILVKKIIMYYPDIEELINDLEVDKEEDAKFILSLNVKCMSNEDSIKLIILLGKYFSIADKDLFSIGAIIIGNSGIYIKPEKTSEYEKDVYLLTNQSTDDDIPNIYEFASADNIKSWNKYNREYILETIDEKTNIVSINLNEKLSPKIFYAYEDVYNNTGQFAPCVYNKYKIKTQEMIYDEYTDTRYYTGIFSRDEVFIFRCIPVERKLSIIKEYKSIFNPTIVCFIVNLITSSKIVEPIIFSVDFRKIEKDDYMVEPFMMFLELSIKCHEINRYTLSTYQITTYTWFDVLLPVTHSKIIETNEFGFTYFKPTDVAKFREEYKKDTVLPTNCKLYPERSPWLLFHTTYDYHFIPTAIINEDDSVMNINRKLGSLAYCKAVMSGLDPESFLHSFPSPPDSAMVA